MAIHQWDRLVADLAAGRPERLPTLVEALLEETRSAVLEAIAPQLLNRGQSLTHDELMTLFGVVATAPMAFDDASYTVTIDVPQTPVGPPRS